MIALAQVRKSRQPDWNVVGVVAFYSSIAFLQLLDFVQWSSAHFVIGCMSLPVLLGDTAQSRYSSRYAYAALVFSGIYVFAPIKTSLYMAVACALLFVYESRQGRTSILALLTVFLMSPIAQHFVEAFSFPIRLQLTALAGGLLHLVDKSVEVAGNVISYNGTDFSVDPACMGLHMLLSSLLCTMLILAIQQKRLAKQLPGSWIGLSLLAALLLNVFSNLIRILLLVQFHIMPGTIMHELVGIACLLLYVIVPLVLVLKWLCRKVAKPAAAHPSSAPSRSNRALHICIGLLMVAGIWVAPEFREEHYSSLPVVPGYKVSHYDSNIVKMEDASSLVYLKDMGSFFSSEHHPMLCWTGTGYLFQQVAEKRISGVPVVCGTLKKGKETLYTAWWYSNGKTQTAHSLGWRWDAVKHGTPYSIVNVTTTSEVSLHQSIARLVADAKLNSWIDRSARLPE